MPRPLEGRRTGFRPAPAGGIPSKTTSRRHIALYKERKTSGSYQRRANAASSKRYRRANELAQWGQVG